jgi:uncharacterized protein YjiS (DUF1127 family)
MLKSTDFDNLAALGEIVPTGMTSARGSSIVVVRHRPAGNDHDYEDLGISEHEIEAWSWRALTGSGFGDAATGGTASFERPTSHAAHQAARAYRSFTLGEIIVAMFQAADSFARQAYERHRRRREARGLYEALNQLDDRMLRDLGFDRCEIRSVAAELAEQAECTRVHAIAGNAGSPDCSPNVTLPEIAHLAMPRAEPEERTIRRYETSAPRFALGFAAVIMMAITIVVFVIVPARMQVDAPEPTTVLASKVAAPESAAVTASTSDVAPVREPGSLTPRAQYPQLTVSRKGE